MERTPNQIESQIFQLEKELLKYQPPQKQFYSITGKLRNLRKELSKSQRKKSVNDWLAQ